MIRNYMQKVSLYYSNNYSVMWKHGTLFQYGIVVTLCSDAWSCSNTKMVSLKWSFFKNHCPNSWLYTMIYCGLLAHLAFYQYTGTPLWYNAINNSLHPTQTTSGTSLVKYISYTTVNYSYKCFYKSYFLLSLVFKRQGM